MKVWPKLAVDNTDKPLEFGGGGGDSSGMPPDDILPRVAVLEQIAKETSETLKGIRSDMKEMRADLSGQISSVRTDLSGQISSVRTELRGEIKAVADRQERDFRISMAWTFIMASTLLGVMAKGFGWV